MTQTNVDLSSIIQMWIDDGRGNDCFWEGWPECPTPEDEITPNMIRALLDAKEAAERERDEACAAIAASAMNVRQQAYDIALNSGNTNRTIAAIISGITIHDTEALRAVKEEVWEEGFCAASSVTCDFRPNPYTKKDTA